MKYTVMVPKPSQTRLSKMKLQVIISDADGVKLSHDYPCKTGPFEFDINADIEYKYNTSKKGLVFDCRVEYENENASAKQVKYLVPQLKE